MHFHLQRVGLIFSICVCVISFFVSLLFLTGGLGNFRLPSYYGNIEMYVETQITVAKIEYFDNSIVVVEEDENKYEHRYVIYGDNYNIFNEKRQEKVLKEIKSFSDVPTINLDEVNALFITSVMLFWKKLY